MVQLDYTFERQIELERMEAYKEGFKEGFKESFVASYTARMALKMLAAGEPIDKIYTYTEISEEELEKLIAEINS